MVTMIMTIIVIKLLVTIDNDNRIIIAAAACRFCWMMTVGKEKK